MNSPESAIDDFVRLTAKSTIAVIVPLYAYWNDTGDTRMNGETLSASLSRIYSTVHNVVIIFVANQKTLPESAAQVLISRSAAGNAHYVPVDRNATYAEYIREGMDYAIHDTGAQFMVVANPWILIQEGGIDAIVERANRPDDAKVVSGYDVHKLMDPGSFERLRLDVPKEDRSVSLDFMAMPRYAAEMATFDVNYQTRDFLQIDLFNTMRSKGFEVITAQQIPIFSFDFPWTEYQTQEMFEADRMYFIKKYGFDPGIVYGQQ